MPDHAAGRTTDRPARGLFPAVPAYAGAGHRSRRIAPVYSPPMLDGRVDDARLRVAMIGGGRGAFIGAVHRAAMRLAGGFHLCAGALSSDPQRAVAGAADVGIPRGRASGDWRSLLASESARPADDRARLVVIVTPNHLHHAPADAALRAGFDVVVDKPLATTSADALDLARRACATGRLLAVTYNYTGYPMIRAARTLVRDGALGTIRKVLVEYHQGWLSRPVEQDGQKQAAWRTDPAQAGVGGAIGDIGSHAENLVGFVTGLEIASLSAMTRAFVPGRRLDDDANVFLRFHGGAGGVLIASQICTGQRNDLVLRLWGTKGGLEWRHDAPETLILRREGGSEEHLHRADPALPSEAAHASSLPAGHPEGFLDAFANLYRGIARTLRGGHDPLLPGGVDGAKGVRFIECVAASAARDGAWTEVPPVPHDLSPGPSRDLQTGSAPGVTR